MNVLNIVQNIENIKNYTQDGTTAILGRGGSETKTQCHYFQISNKIKSLYKYSTTQMILFFIFSTQSMIKKDRL